MYDVHEFLIDFQSLLPRGHTKNKLREKNEQVNTLLAEKYNGKNRLQIVRVDKGKFLADFILQKNR